MYGFFSFWLFRLLFLAKSFESDGDLTWTSLNRVCSFGARDQTGTRVHGFYDFDCFGSTRAWELRLWHLFVLNIFSRDIIFIQQTFWIKVKDRLSLLKTLLRLILYQNLIILLSFILKPAWLILLIYPLCLHIFPFDLFDFKNSLRNRFLKTVFLNFQIILRLTLLFQLILNFIESFNRLASFFI